MAGRRINTSLRQQIDLESEALKVITTEHYMIHQGRHFVASDFATIGDGTTRRYLIQTKAAANGEVHLVFGVSGSLHTTLKFYSNPGMSGGTLLPIANSNQRSLKTASTIITHTPNIDSGSPSEEGDLLWQGQFGSDAAAQRLGGQLERGREWELQSSEYYLLDVKSLSTDNNISVQFIWYELIESVNTYILS